MKIKSLLKAILICSIYLIASSFQSPNSLKGTWVYQGGIYNGLITTAPKGIKLERVYSENEYQAFITNQNGKKTKYEAGNYSLDGNTYIEIQTYSTKPTPAKDKTLRYNYSIKDNKVTFKGKLPDKTSVQETWKKVQ
jgi:hypothetical protein